MMPLVSVGPHTGCYCNVSFGGWQNGRSGISPSNESVPSIMQATSALLPSTQPSTADSVAFGSHRLHPSQRALLRDGVPVALRGRAMDLLLVLVERAGEVVPLDVLAKLIWAGERVEEATIRVHIGTLRKALNAEATSTPCIVNIPGRGYSFVASLTRLIPTGTPPIDLGPSTPKTNLPSLRSSIVGREKTIEVLLDMLTERRLITVVGPGGVGKTTVAVAVAHARTHRQSDAVWFVDLAAIDHPSLVPSAVAEVLGLPVGAADPYPQILNALRSRPTLIVLDSCEHVVEAAAALAETLLRGNSGTRILATSREALRAEGESVHRLPTLAYPGEGAVSTVDQALTFASVQLFVERAKAMGSGFRLDDPTAVEVANICRHLDGIALAIELAAGRVGTLGIAGVAHFLSHQIGVLSQDRRAATPRQQTLIATLDWSYRLLSESDKKVFRRLSVFVGVFSMASAISVVADTATTGPIVLAAIANLAARSLIAVNFEGERTSYRLLETTRRYAQDLLEQGDETQAMSQRHARAMLAALSIGERERAAQYGPLSHQLGNIRSALTWAFDARQNALASALASAAATVFLDLSLFAECNRWVTRALEALGDADKGSRVERELQTVFAVTLTFLKGDGEEVVAAWNQALSLAEAVNDAEIQQKVLEGLFVHHIRGAQIGEMMKLAERSASLVQRLPTQADNTAWMHGLASHFMGLHSNATLQCSAALRLPPRPRQANVIRFGVDLRLHAHCALARSKWLQGDWTEAWRSREDALREARVTCHPTSLCVALAWSAEVPLWSKDLDIAAKQVEELESVAKEHMLAPHHAISVGFKGDIALQRGDFAEALELLDSSLKTLHTIRHAILIGAFTAARASALSALGRHADARAAIVEGIRFVTERSQFLYLPELLRIQAEVLAASSESDFRDVEIALTKSIALARDQGATACELRSTTSLVRIRRERGIQGDEVGRLRDVTSRISNQPDLPDLRLAHALLG